MCAVCWMSLSHALTWPVPHWCLQIGEIYLKMSVKVVCVKLQQSVVQLALNIHFRKVIVLAADQ